MKGKGLKPARGTCRNPFLAVAKVKTPVVAEEKEAGMRPEIRKVYEYDVQTKAGETILVKPQFQ